MTRDIGDPVARKDLPVGRKIFSEQLKATPTKPGVYIMRDRDGTALYVGKASNLRNRLRSYFANPARLEPKIRILVSKIADFDFIIAGSDQEAVLLESNLIKRHQPVFNARLKDDKSYSFIKIDITEDFPQVYVTRNVSNDGARYFGPFASASSVRKTLALLKKLFPYRSCTKPITGADSRPCLDYHINRCVGPCIGAASKERYGEIIDEVTLFMRGQTKSVVKSITSRMEKASNDLDFENAALLRDQIKAIHSVQAGQKVLLNSRQSFDAIALAKGDTETWVEIFFVRNGKVIGKDGFMMAGTNDTDSSEIVTAFVKQFYDANPYVPGLILLQHHLEDAPGIQCWLTDKRGGKVKVLVPQRGEKRNLISMVAENAANGLKQRAVKDKVTGGLTGALEELQEALSLPRVPTRIECYDISNLQGTNAVGSMVVFVDGKRLSSDYRRFKIRTVDGIDDYSMMREILSRRFQRMSKSSNHETVGSKPSGLEAANSDEEVSWQIIPDLVLIDGGKGHLGAALQVLLEFGIDFVPLASLAKDNEELFVPHIPEPVLLPRKSNALYLVQQLRDEAHRFAITYHRQRRSKTSVRSAIDQIPGIGLKRRRMLLKTFGSVEGVRQAALDDIVAIPGMTLMLARTIKEQI
jgi:excinuclease ABC subunit C